MNTPLEKTWFCIEFPSLEYAKAWNLQKQMVAALRSETINANVVLILEHPPVFTLGRRGGSKNLTVTEDFLKKAAIPIFQVERGGDITYHGPGQLIAYPIFNLRAAKTAVADYVTNLEEMMIRTAGDWNIKAERNPLNRGVWIGKKKLGSLGIALQHGISFHGLAFNVNCSLEPFGWIHPCGLQGVGVTSMEQELLNKVSMPQVRQAIKSHFQSLFDTELVMITVSELLGEDKDGPFTQGPKN